jgi:ATP-dependent DNA ligase
LHDGEWVYVGRVGTGFTDEMLRTHVAKSPATALI